MEDLDEAVKGFLLLLNLMMAEVKQPGAAPQSPPKSSKSSKSKEEKRKYPKIRKALVEQYGLSIRDHFVRDCCKKCNLDENNPDLNAIFEESKFQTLTSIAEPYLPQSLTNNNNKKNKGNYKGIDKLRGRSLLQIFSTRDVSKSQQQQNPLHAGSDKSRMLHFVLTDGKNKVNAIEYQHVVLLELDYINYPCTHLYDDNFYFVTN